MLRTLLLILVIWIADPCFAEWTQRADFGGSARHRASGLSVGNRGYMGLGHFNGTGVETYFSDWWDYDPGTNAWTQKADFIGNNGQGDLGVVGFGNSEFAFAGAGELYLVPSNNQLFAKVNAEKQGEFEFRFIDVSGSIMLESITMNKGDNEIQLNTFSKLESGVYIVEILDLEGDRIHQQRVVKL